MTRRHLPWITKQHQLSLVYLLCLFVCLCLYSCSFVRSFVCLFYCSYAIYFYCSIIFKGKCYFFVLYCYSSSLLSIKIWLKKKWTLLINLNRCVNRYPYVINFTPGTDRRYCKCNEDLANWLLLFIWKIKLKTRIKSFVFCLVCSNTLTLLSAIPQARLIANQRV